MSTLSRQAALSAIAVLIAYDFVDRVCGKVAVHELISATRRKDRETVASAAIGMLLDRAENADRYTGVCLVGRALGIAILWTPNVRTAERLVSKAAHTGFINRFPSLPAHLLHRAPSAEEVVALITGYVNDRASSCTMTENKLKGLATHYLSEESAKKEIERIRQFAYDFENTIDL